MKATGDLVCWGDNGHGQCDVPPDLGPVVAVAAGEFHTCPVKANGDLVCFGNNDCGQCDAPPDLGPVVAVAAGGFHTCAVKAMGDLVCFGDNHHGQCDVPLDLGPVVAVAAGTMHTRAVEANESLVRFGTARNPPQDLGCLLLPASQGKDPVSPSWAEPAARRRKRAPLQRNHGKLRLNSRACCGASPAIRPGAQHVCGHHLERWSLQHHL